MIGAIIGGALQGVSSILGGLAASKAAQKRRDSLLSRKEKNKAWFDDRYNQSYTQRADAQRMLQMTSDAIRSRNKAVAGRQAVMGGTEASVAAEKERNNKLYGDTVSKINADNEARKDRIEQIYQNREDRIDNALENTEMQRAEAITRAAEGAGKAAGAIATSVDDLWDDYRGKKKEEV